MRKSGIISILLLAIIATSVQAKVFFYRKQALKLAFPGADVVEKKNFLLKKEELKRVQTLAKVPVDSRMFTFYIGKKKGKVIGFAAIDSHTVRTMPETFMAVINPDGKIRSIHILAFYEPLEYLSPLRWLKQFVGRGLSSDLRINRDIQGITGATLSARAVTRGVRKVLALYLVLVKEK